MKKKKLIVQALIIVAQGVLAVIVILGLFNLIYFLWPEADLGWTFKDNTISAYCGSTDVYDHIYNKGHKAGYWQRANEEEKTEEYYAASQETVHYWDTKDINDLPICGIMEPNESFSWVVTDNLVTCRWCRSLRATYWEKWHEKCREERDPNNYSSYTTTLTISDEPLPVVFTESHIEALERVIADYLQRNEPNDLKLTKEP